MIPPDPKETAMTTRNTVTRAALSLLTLTVLAFAAPAPGDQAATTQPAKEAPAESPWERARKEISGGSVLTVNGVLTSSASPGGAWVVGQGGGGGGGGVSAAGGGSQNGPSSEAMRYL